MCPGISVHAFVCKHEDLQTEWLVKYFLPQNKSLHVVYISVLSKLELKAPFKNNDK